MAKGGWILISALLLVGVQLVLGQNVNPTDTRANTQPPPDKTIQELTFALPMVIVLILVVVIFLVVAFVIYRAHYGYFCCLKPRMSYRVPERTSEQEDDPESQRENVSLPEYQSNNGEQQPVSSDNIAPPDYRDALQDVLVSSGGPTMIEAPMDTEETVLSEDTPARLEFDSQDSTPPDEQENELEESSENDDDRTPLNP